MAADPIAPDVVIVGAARAGTSFLSATLSNHPSLDGGAIKEPNYYSSMWSEGPDWYDGLFAPRSSGLLRLDSSVSYTYPQHTAALQRLSGSNPDVQIVYTVREPAARLVSHFQLMRYYVGHDKWPTLSAAVAGSPMFMSSGAYDEWLLRLRDNFRLENILVVPFPVVTSDVASVVELILGRLGLTTSADQFAASGFRNEVRQFRSPLLTRAHNRMVKSRYYPAVRARVGPDVLRRVRQQLTRSADLPSRDSELATLTDAQRDELADAGARAVEAVGTRLAEQDAQLDLDWLARWTEHTTRPTAPPAI